MNDLAEMKTFSNNDNNGRRNLKSRASITIGEISSMRANAEKTLTSSTSTNSLKTGSMRRLSLNASGNTSNAPALMKPKDIFHIPLAGEGALDDLPFSFHTKELFASDDDSSSSGSDSDYDSNYDSFASFDFFGLDGLDGDDTEASTEPEADLEVPNRKVTFNPKLLIEPTISLKNYTKREKIATWITPQERLESLNEVRAILDLLNNGVEIDENSEYCARGLEFQTEMAREISLTVTHQCIAAVWEEQSRQWMSGEDNQELIAEIYGAMTEGSQEFAEHLANLDAQYVQQHVLGKDA